MDAFRLEGKCVCVRRNNGLQHHMSQIFAIASIKSLIPGTASSPLQTQCLLYLCRLTH